MSSAARLNPNQIDGRSEALSVSELDRYRDAEWAMHDAEVQRRFPGQWVVAYERKVIAHGTDPKAVLVEACHVASGQNHRLVFCADSTDWLDHPTDLSRDFAHACLPDSVSVGRFRDRSRPSCPGETRVPALH